MDRAILNECSSQIINAAMRVHSILGPGLLESPYRACLAYELRKRGFRVDEELPVPVIYDEHKMPVGLRLDLLVNDLVVVEVKACAKVNPVHEATLLTYLKMSDHRLGLIINFHELRLRDGLKRLVNGF